MQSSLRIALAQVNTTVGDLAGNARIIKERIEEAKKLGVDIVAFPELTISGYPPEDLLLYQPFIDENKARLRELAKSVDGIVAVVGFPEQILRSPQTTVRGKSPERHELVPELFNAAAVLTGNRVAHVYHKRDLPNYGVFDEKRYFSTGGQPCPVYDMDGTKFGVNICEDIWSPYGPSEVQAAGGAEVIITINGSPYTVHKDIVREKLITDIAVRNRVYVAYVNMVGGQDELVFDGGSRVVGPDGDLITEGPFFEEALIVLDLDIERVRRARRETPREARKCKDEWCGTTDGPSADDAKTYPVPLPKTVSKPVIPAPVVRSMSEVESIYRALVVGTRDYLRKSGFSKALIGMSGGVDSTIVAVIAADAIGAENVTGVAMPSRYSADQSLDDATEVCRRLGMELLNIPIALAHDAFDQMLAPAYASAPANVAEENVQSRIRGNVLMSLSNKFGAIVLTTGNKSEMATGYATLYGDMAGGYAVIKDVPKTLIYQLCDWRNGTGPGSPIPQSVIDRPPTAELKPGQLDQDSLPPYPVLDRVLEMYVERRMPIKEIVASEATRDGERADPETVLKVVRMVDRNEYKRRQAPPGVNISGMAFGRDRRLPLASKWRHQGWPLP